MRSAPDVLRVVAASLVVVAGLTACPRGELDEERLLETIATFEVAIRDQPRETVRELLPGREVAFSCRFAALIRGRSVDCAPDGLEVTLGRAPVR